MVKRRFLRNLIAISLSAALLLGSTLAYFSDKAYSFAFGNSGNISVVVTGEDGKDVYAYDTANDISFSVTNSGNMSMDVKAVVTVESGMPIVQGIDVNGTKFPCYRMFNSANPSYTYSYTVSPSVSFSETANPTPLTGTNVTDAQEPTKYKMKYEFSGILNGGHPTKENETETGGVSTFTVPLSIYLPKYELMDTWEDLTENVYYKITVQIYGKQHRNSSNDDWTLLGVF